MTLWWNKSVLHFPLCFLTRSLPIIVSQLSVECSKDLSRVRIPLHPPLLFGTANRLIPPKHCDALTYHEGALRSIRNEYDRWAEPIRRPAGVCLSASSGRTRSAWSTRWVSTGELAQLGQAHGRFCTLQRRRFAFGLPKAETKGGRKSNWLKQFDTAVL